MEIPSNYLTSLVPVEASSITDGVIIYDNFTDVWLLRWNRIALLV